MTENRRAMIRGLLGEVRNQAPVAQPAAVEVTVNLCAPLFKKKPASNVQVGHQARTGF
jgi:hypothetical protein